MPTPSPPDSSSMGQNPTSGVLSVRRRKELYALCSKYDVIIVEDDPYWYLQYPSATAFNISSGRTKPTKAHARTGKSSGYAFLDSLVPSYLSVDTDGRVVRLDTFSKTVAPGCRLGWVCSLSRSVTTRRSHSSRSRLLLKLLSASSVSPNAARNNRLALFKRSLPS